MNLSNVTNNLFAAIVCLLVMSSCTDYGKKVTFTGNKGEVYYKGDGVTEADAKATGNFLADQQYFDNDKGRSVQISKDSGHIKARFVVDEKALGAVKDADEKFALIGAMLSKNVFNNTPVDVIYADENFKDIKTIPYNSGSLTQVNFIEELKQMQKKNHNKNTFYYSKDFTEEEATGLFNYLLKSGLFPDDGNSDLIATKTTGGGFHFKFPVKASFANEEGYQKTDTFAKQMKQDMFANSSMEFELLDEKMNHLKTFSY